MITYFKIISAIIYIAIWFHYQFTIFRLHLIKYNYLHLFFSNVNLSRLYCKAVGPIFGKIVQDMKNNIYLKLILGK